MSSQTDLSPYPVLGREVRPIKFRSRRGIYYGPLTAIAYVLIVSADPHNTRSFRTALFVLAGCLAVFVLVRLRRVRLEITADAISYSDAFLRVRTIRFSEIRSAELLDGGSVSRYRRFLRRNRRWELLLSAHVFPAPESEQIRIPIWEFGEAARDEIIRLLDPPEWWLNPRAAEREGEKLTRP